MLQAQTNSWWQRLHRPRFQVFVLIPILSLLLQTPLWQQDAVGTHKWRQTLTLTMARAFYQEPETTVWAPKTADRYMEDGVFLFEFPLLQWTLAKAYALFGEQVWVFRLYMWLLSLGIVWAMYAWSKLLFQSEHIGVFSAWVLAFCPLFFYYSRNPMPDVLALGLSIGACYAYERYHHRKQMGALVLFGLLASLAVLVKLPFVIILAIPGLLALARLPWSVRLSRTKQRFVAALPLLVLVLALLPAVYWYGVHIQDNWYARHKLFNVHTEAQFPPFKQLLFMLADAGISWFAYLLIGWPLLLFWGKGLWLNSQEAFRQRRVPSAVLLIVLLLTFVYYVADIAVILNVHDYYLLPFLVSIPVITARGIASFKIKAQWLILWGGLWVAYGAAVAYPMWFQDRLFHETLYTQREKLQAAVPDDAYVLVTTAESAPTLALYYLGKRGVSVPYHPFAPDSLPNYIRNKGLRYYYSSIRAWDTLPQMQPYYKQELPAVGEFRILELQVPSKPGKPQD